MKPKLNLEELKRENVYHVPEDYFDRLPNRIMQRVTATPPETAGAFGWFPKPLRLALAGSGFAAVFATVFMLNVNQQQTGYEQQLAQLNDTEIMHYLLTSERLERTDLAVLTSANQDLTHEFLNVNAAEIQRELEEAYLDETLL